MIEQSLAGAWEFREVGTSKWLPARVPGTVHTDLLSAGRIPDPFVLDNELRVQWVAERDWEYRLVFRADPALAAAERCTLVFDGLDTLAEVKLNDHRLGRAENMFRQYRWDVAPILGPGENELRVTFFSPVVAARSRQAEQPLLTVSHSIAGAPHLRKAPCQFGWDWGPRLPSSGIWKDVRLEGGNAARIDDVRLRQRHRDGRVIVEAGVQLERWQPGDLRIVLRVGEPDGQACERELLLTGGAAAGRLTVQIDDPRLWWPNGYGPQPLYDVQVALYQDDTLRDRRAFRIGLRRLELLQEPDAYGTSFGFAVNGVPVFAKGANWIPADSFPTRVRDEHLEHLIRSAAAAHMNLSLIHI